MATEPFLINPPRRLHRKRRKNPIGETLVTIGANPMRYNPWYGDSEGHRIAALMRWGKVSGRKVSRYRRRVRHKAVRRVKRVVRRAVSRRRVRHTVDRRTKAYAAMIKRQRREAASYMGLSRFKHGVGWVLRRKHNSNPYYGGTMARHRRRKARRNTWFGQPKRHRKAAKKGWRRGHMLVVRKRRRRVRHANPIAATNPRRHRRSRRHSYRVRRRHNPAIMAQFGKFTGGIADVRSWAPLAITGGLSAVTGAVVPGMLGIVNPWAKYGVQTAVAIGGGIVVENFVDKRHGQAWMVVGVAMVGYQLLKEFVLQPYFPQFAVGLGDYESYYPVGYEDRVSQSIDAFPQGMHAFPQAMSAYPGVGGDSVGAYPYDGSPY